MEALHVSMLLVITFYSIGIITAVGWNTAMYKKTLIKPWVPFTTWPNINEIIVCSSICSADSSCNVFNYNGNNCELGSESDLGYQADGQMAFVSSVDGGWSDFGPFSNCSVSCGDGFYNRTRNCTNPIPIGAGANCQGSNTDIQNCFTGILCCNTTTITEANYIIYGYSSDNVLTDDCEIVTQSGIYFLSPTGTVNKGFILDLTCTEIIETFALRNTKNGNGNDRGTNGFTVEVSIDNSTWNLVITGALQDVRNQSCSDFPLQTFPLVASTSTMARFIRFRPTSYYGSGAGLGYFDWKQSGCGPLTVITEAVYSTNYAAVNVLADLCDNVFMAGLFYMTPDGIINQGFIIDTGCPQSIRTITMRNSHNSVANDRGTNGFTIDMSTDNVTWNLAIAGNLPDVRNLACNVPLNKFALSTTTIARYIRFRPTSYYGLGAALGYLDWRSGCGQVTVTPEAVFNSYYSPINVLFDVCEGLNQAGIFYVTPDYVINQGFIIDTGCQQAIAWITLRNTHSGNSNDRGTNGFTLELSNDNSNWSLVVTAALQDVRNKSCNDNQLRKYPLSTTTMARYIRFRPTSYFGYGPGLEYLDWRQTCSIGENCCIQKIITEGAYDASTNYVADNVLSDVCESVNQPGVYYLSPSTTINKGFIIDIGCEETIAAFVLRNTKNGDNNDRGTNGFTLEISTDNSTWNLVITGTLQDARNQNCTNIPLQKFNLVNTVIARYIRFRPTSYYGNGAGLEYINWRQQSGCGPVTISTEAAYSTIYAAVNVLADSCESNTTAGFYYLTPDSSTNLGFIIDTGCYQSISTLSVRNTHNSNFMDRGTNGFTIDLSADNAIWTRVVTSSLPNSSNWGCNVPLTQFSLSISTMARYVRFRPTSYYGVGAGLEYIDWRSGCDPVTVTAESVHGPNYAVLNVLFDTCEVLNQPGIYYLGQNYMVNKGFIIDTGCQQAISTFTLRNTHNGDSNDRATNGFSIEVSNNNSTWSLVVTGALPDARNQTCSGNPIQRFPLSATTMARYIRFRPTSYFGAGPGLEYLDWRQ